MRKKVRPSGFTLSSSSDEDSLLLLDDESLLEDVASISGIGFTTLAVKINFK